VTGYVTKNYEGVDRVYYPVQRWIKVKWD